MKATSESEGGADALPVPAALNESQDSSSNAGDSGWSSSAGVSSLRSGSFESMEGEAVPPGSTLAAIGAVSAIAAGGAAVASRDRYAMNFPCQIIYNFSLISSFPHLQKR